MGYQKSLHDIQIGDLVHFTEKLRTLKESVWEISRSNAKLHEILGFVLKVLNGFLIYTLFRRRIATVDNRIADFDAKCQSMADDALLLGLERMKSHVPVDAIDPLLCVFADREMTKAAVSVLTAHYDVLNGYAHAIFGNLNQNPAFNRPALPEHNKYILFVRERYVEAMRMSKEFEQLGENCRPHNSQVFYQFLRISIILYF